MYVYVSLASYQLLGSELGVSYEPLTGSVYVVLWDVRRLGSEMEVRGGTNIFFRSRTIFEGKKERTKKQQLKLDHVIWQTPERKGTIAVAPDATSA